METLLYDSASGTMESVLTRYRQGDLRLLCPECREELVVVLDEEAMQRTHRHAGTYCPNSHVERLFELRAVHERIRGVFERLRKDASEHSEAPIIEVHPNDDGWLECPGCHTRFTLRDRRFAEEKGLWRHSCGQRVRWEGQI